MKRILWLVARLVNALHARPTYYCMDTISLRNRASETPNNTAPLTLIPTY